MNAHSNIQQKDKRRRSFSLPNFIRLFIKKFKIKNSKNNGFEEVFYYDWYDGPISGVTNKNGKPHFFEYQGYNEDAKESYYLTPISKNTLQLVVESWQIWKRWETAFHRQEIGIKSHPYLPEDKEKGTAIKKILDEPLNIDNNNYIELYAEFKVKENQENILGSKTLLVKWKENKN